MSDAKTCLELESVWNSWNELVWNSENSWNKLVWKSGTPGVSGKIPKRIQKEKVVWK
jgi:hypothetical protein